MIGYRGRHSSKARGSGILSVRGRHTACASAGFGRQVSPTSISLSLQYVRGRAKPVVIVTSALAAIAVCAVPVAAQAYEGQSLRQQYDRALVEAQDSRATLAHATGYAASVSYSTGDLPASMAIMVSSLKSQLAKADALENRDAGNLSDSSADSNEGLSRTVAALDRESRDQNGTAQTIVQIVNDLGQYRDLKQTADACKALDSALSAAQAAIDAPNWRTGDERVKAALDALSEAVSAAGAVDRHDPAAMQQTTTALTNDMRALTEAIAAYDAAANAAAASAAGDRNPAAESSSLSKRRSGQSTSTRTAEGYTLAGDCYTAAECQADIDVAGRNQLHALHTPKGSTYYEIHNDHGGSSTWGKSTVTINGVTHNLGQWRPARYNSAGQPIEESEQGTYFQTCDANGKVWFAPMQ